MSFYRESDEAKRLIELLLCKRGYPLRFRDCWIKEKKGTSRLIVTLYARQGGGNRVSYKSDMLGSDDEPDSDSEDDAFDSVYEKNNKSYHDHPYFISDKDASCDETYNKIRFDVTNHPLAEEFRKLL